jgi:hypothetical protein
MTDLVCTECPHIFTEAELAAEGKSSLSRRLFSVLLRRKQIHPCHANVTDRFGPVPTACKSRRKPLAEETENERILRRRRAFMPDYDKALDQWLS